MTSLAAFKRAVTAGTVLRCVENTYRPELNGTTRTIERAGPSVCLCATGGKSGFRMEWPKASDVLSVEARRITYKIGRGDHTVTLEIA